MQARKWISFYSMSEPASADPQPLQVFLCHSSGDKDKVRDLCRRLRMEDGIDPWFDEERLLLGQAWQDEITKALRRSDVVIVCLSNGSITKEGYLNREIKYALDVAEEKLENAIFLIPTKLEPCEVPERWRKWQWATLYEASGYERLVSALRMRQGQKAATPSPHVRPANPQPGSNPVLSPGPQPSPVKRLETTSVSPKGKPPVETDSPRGRRFRLQGYLVWSKYSCGAAVVPK